MLCLAESRRVLRRVLGLEITFEWWSLILGNYWVSAFTPPKWIVSCLTCALHRSGTVTGKLYVGNPLNSTGKGAGMVLLKNVGKYGGASFPIFLIWGAAGVYHSTAGSAGLGWGACSCRQGLECVACMYNTIHTYIHTYIPWIHVSYRSRDKSQVHIYRFTVSNTTNILQKYSKSTLHIKKSIYTVKAVCM